MKRLGALLAVLFALPTALAWGQTPRAKKLIAAGWDSPTTAQLRRDLAKMETAPLDGTTVWLKATGTLPPGVNGTPPRTAFSRQPWKREWFAQAVADLRAVKASRTRLTDNFVRMDANPGDVDWFDDAGWREVTDHFRIAAWVAKQGGCKGLAFDAEPYTKPFVPFDPRAQPEGAKHTFDDYLAKARQRGREVMAAVASEFPDAVVLTFFMHSYLVESSPFHGPTPTGRDADGQKRALFLHSYGLYPAFLDGWLDVLPKAMTLIDGNEHAYGYTTEAEFFRAAARVKNDGQELVSPANRAKYRAQVQVGSGIYLDAHVAALKNPYRLPGASVALLGRNVASALRAADEYVWLWGEQGRWFPEPGGLTEWPGKEVFPTWEARLPGVGTALTDARNPDAAAERRARAAFDALGASGKAENLARNGDFAAGPAAQTRPAASGASPDWGTAGAPDGWSYWQEDFSKGRFGWDEKVKAARASGVRSGVFLQTVPARPGERFYVAARSRTTGKGAPALTLAWKKADDAWLPAETRKLVVAPRLETGAGSDWGTFAVAPPGAGLLVVLLGVEGQASPADTLWWDDVRVVRLPAEQQEP